MIFSRVRGIVEPLAYAGFSKEGGPENLKTLKTKRKIFPRRISLFSCSKLGEDQTRKKKDLHSELVRFLAQN